MPNTHPLLFLDVDGVLNSGEFGIMRNRAYRQGNTYDPFTDDLDPRACSTLLYIQEQVPEARIVLSSTWRIGETLESASTKLAAALLSSDRLVGLTPDHGYNTPRGGEIQAYLDANGAPPFIAILDDDADMGDKLLPLLVQTDPMVGLTIYDAQKVIGLLQRSSSIEKS